ncbi:MAG TPA: mechanosensitive ion channel domain-containing protein, partial [Xanthomonadales bacterium]|nr:mechanosensitive ion channel domain-containing protein [Xanthomonadales bacterium]
MRSKFFLPLTVLFLWIAATPAVLAQSLQSQPEAIETAPVIIDGKELFRLRGISSYPARERAETVRGRIIAVAGNRLINPSDLRTETDEDLVKIMAGDQLLIGLVNVDAKMEGVSLSLLAETHKERIATTITQYRNDRSRDRLLRNGLFALVATAVLILSLWGVLRLYKVLNRWAERHLQESIKKLTSKSYHLLHPGQLWRVLAGLVSLTRLVLIVALSYFYLNAVLGLFPWTRPFAVVLLTLILDPLKSIGLGLIEAIPDLIFLVILILVVRYVLKLIRAFFAGVRGGRIHLEKFDSDWAMPTYKIVRFMVIAFSLVIAYPYIPGSDSMAFKGVSVFLGVLLSLGSSSFIANSLAGLSMTYRGAFKTGDVVRIGDVMGRVDDIRGMVTRVRTPKNEIVTIPNSNILNTDVINYSTFTRDEGILLHSSVGIGYDTPWRQVEAMLMMAAERTGGLETDPPAFVRQKSLGDYAVEYELNAMCKDEQQMLELYSKLNANIQDVFNEHGVQIMSPRYVADTSEPKLVPPSKWYTSPARKPDQLE